MKYIRTDGRIEFIDDDPMVIPLAEAVRVCRDVAKKIEALDYYCECEELGLGPCGGCGRPPDKRKGDGVMGMNQF